MSRRILIVTAVQAEADAIGKLGDTFVIASGIGRVNAAITTTISAKKTGDSARPRLCFQNVAQYFVFLTS